ncbi:SAM-dependent methyltransferase [Kitasatospora sp. NBC_01287]|uniref:SAM-dependent methyltransferase n=1 Tax=Kitasatospora sp. NBC_01287 TaxID=2903573 RepID=UPI00224EE705|nr:SAM-dependent methyltransferase [Kitasatospora sp. NBC_01287]MCX4744865.1 SAM-dependent methyltransferase [Kitasatospora sp. NBC_01287]
MTSQTSDLIPEGVGRTAVGVARARAVESARADRLFDDPYAAAFVTAAHGGNPAPPRANPTPALIALARHLVIRTRFYDDYLLTAAREGCVQVVVPAAGLDTRAFRLDWPSGTRVFELDMPPVLAFKERVLAEQGAVAPVPRSVLAADLREPWAAVLTAAGFDPAVRSVWLVEGLLVYLGSAEVTDLLSTIGELSAPGSRLGLTHGRGKQEGGDPQGPRPEEKAQELGLEVRLMTDLWRGGLDEDPVDWLARHGWRAERHDRAELAVGYGRPADYVSQNHSFITAERTGGPEAARQAAQ